MNVQIINNDIEIDGEKVARIFDIRATLMSKLEEAVDQASRDLEEEEEVNYESGKAEGFAKGFAEGQEAGATEES
jgi:flagellar biosynthesis/type III secretory pathway protein FliH